MLATLCNNLRSTSQQSSQNLLEIGSLSINFSRKENCRSYAPDLKEKVVVEDPDFSDLRDRLFSRRLVASVVKKSPASSRSSSPQSPREKNVALPKLERVPQKQFDVSEDSIAKVPPISHQPIQKKTAVIETEKDSVLSSSDDSCRGSANNRDEHAERKLEKYCYFWR